MYAAALYDFLRLESGTPEMARRELRANPPCVSGALRATNTEEGSVMATTLADVITDLRTSRRAAILEEFRTSTKILDLFKQGVE